MTQTFKRKADGTTYYWKEGDIYGAPTLMDGSYDVSLESCLWDFDLTENQKRMIKQEVTNALGDPYDG